MGEGTKIVESTGVMAAQPAATGYDLDTQIGYILRLVNQRHAAIFQSRMEQDLTPTQFSALVRIHQKIKCSQNQLGRLAAMDAATIKGVIERLHNKGLVVLEPDHTDKRRNLISLSDKGRALMAGLYKVGADITRDTLQPLSRSDQRSLLYLLKKMT